MQYQHTQTCIFEDRPNRFIAHVWIDGKLETVHVKNTGRLGELLIPGAQATVQRSDNPSRKTKYDLISIYKPGLGWVNIDSQVTNTVVHEWLKKEGFEKIKPEYSYGRSRLDFYAEKDGIKYLIEVKGCTLEREGLGWFPDAKSVRAVLQGQDLMQAMTEGYQSVIAYVIAMEGVAEVRSNTAKDPAYAQMIEDAKAQGVKIWHFACSVMADAITINSIKK